MEKTEKEKLEERISSLGHGYPVMQKSKEVKAEVEKTKATSKELELWTRQLTEKFNSTSASRK